MITEEIRRSLSPDIVIAGGRIEDVREHLFPAEAVSMVRAVEKRRAEFSAGRAYARRALAGLGVAPVAIPVGADRAPRWPPNVVGSISHCEHYCGAIVAYRSAFASLGFDVEANDDLPHELISEICSPHELVCSQDGDVHLPKLIFCIKESVYKAYFPIARTILGFRDAVVEIQPNGRFVARLAPDVPPMGTNGRSFRGHFLMAAGIVAAWTAVPCSERETS